MLRRRAIESVRGYPDGSELQAALARALGERADAAVVAVAAAVEDHGLGAGVLRALGDQLAGALGLLHARKLTQLGLGPVDGGERVAAHVVDHLGLHAAVRAEDGEPRAIARPRHLRADAPAAAQACLVARLHGHARLPTLRATYSSA